jgi:hypothetical protein
VSYNVHNGWPARVGTLQQDSPLAIKSQQVSDYAAAHCGVPRSAFLIPGGEDFTW